LIDWSAHNLFYIVSLSTFVYNFDKPFSISNILFCWIRQ